MIPKTIHYCWFGNNPKSKLVEKCIKSWKKYCPDYEIVEWNENNYDISSAPLYVRQAYAAKKWAFVTDYVRLDVVYRNGGIYLDTDVEVIKNLDSLLIYKSYFGFEDSEINTGLGFGSVAKAPILLSLMEDYQTIPFENSNGEFDLTPCPIRNTVLFESKGLIKNNTFQMLDGEIAIFPSDYFCPMTWERKLKITKNTYSIHRYSASWWDKAKKKSVKKRVFVQRYAWLIFFPVRLAKKILGEKIVAKLKHKIGKKI